MNKIIFCVLSFFAVALAQDVDICPPISGEDPDCSDKIDGQYANEDFCDRYYDCVNRQLYAQHECSGDLLYKPDIKGCDNPDRVTCDCRRVCEDADHEDCHLQEVTTEPPPLEECTPDEMTEECVENDEDGCTYVAVTTPCSPFYCACAPQGHAYKQKCLDGLFFDPALCGCNLPEAIPACNV